MNATAAEPTDNQADDRAANLATLRALGVSPAQLARASVVDAADIEVFLRWYAQVRAIEE